MQDRRKFTLIFALATVASLAQQVPDQSFDPPVPSPAYAEGRGPVVFVDEGHNNFHTAGGRYQAFAKLLRRDGYRVEPSAAPFTAEHLSRADILVISNALAVENVGNESLPNPSAFTSDEIAAVRAWIEGGGSLLLIADHMPWAGCATDLGRALGVHFTNGFIRGILTFEPGMGLADHPITRGRNEKERIDAVTTFTGSAFRMERGKPLLTFVESTESLNPKVPWQFDADTPKVDVTGWQQGGTLHIGEGRVAVFGEAAMFTAQLDGPNRVPVGMNSPRAEQNAQFVLNLAHWLSGPLDE